MKRLLACLLVILMVMTVAPMTVFAADGDPELITNIKVTGVSLDLKAGHVPDVTGTLDKSLSGKLQTTAHGWIYMPEDATQPTADDGDQFEPPYYYWTNSDKLNKMYPQKNLKTITAGQQYQYILDFRIADIEKYDFSDDITVTINGKKYTKQNAALNVHHNVYYSEDVDPKNPPDISEMEKSHILQLVIPVTAAKRADGWQKSGGKWYYIKNNKEHSGWQQVKGVWYYLSPTMVTTWKRISGKWYYFNTSGAMQTGWLKNGGKWYLFNASGAMLTGWQKNGGKWYLFNASGAMQTGWQKSGGKWYYLNTSGAMQTGWLKLSGKWYYLDSSGAMIAGKSLTIGGKTYRFNASGVCTNP